MGILFLVFVVVFVFVYKKLSGYSSPQSVFPNVSYEELLTRDEWKVKREEILERDNYECQYCHSRNRTLQVHHKYYLKYPNGRKVYPWEYPNKALITLCDKCHKWEHSKRNPKTYYTKYK